MDLENIKKELSGYFELVSYPEIMLDKKQPELLQAMSESAIHSFGWPIGIVLPNEDYKPIITQKGVRATIDVKSGTRESFDFWELQKTGEFYLLKSLFEDRRGKDFFFFDVRIKRIAEALLRIGKLYRQLGADNNVIIAIKLSYSGIKGRKLVPASPEFFSAIERTCGINNFEFTIKANVGELNNKDYLSLKVKEICSELFILFDGAVIGESVFEKVLNQFFSKVL